MTTDHEPNLEQLSTAIRGGIIEGLALDVRLYTDPTKSLDERQGHLDAIMIKLRNTSHRAFHTPEAQDAFMYRILTGEPMPVATPPEA